MTALEDATHRTYAWFGLLVSKGFDLRQQHRKVRAEAIEYADDRTLEELADVYITVIGELVPNGWSIDELAVAVDTKMAINEKRSWAQKPDGTYQHTTEGDH